MAKPAQYIKPKRAIFSFLSQPCADPVRSGIHIAHPTNLMPFFCGILLINADGIHPKELCAFFRAQLTQSRFQIRGHIDDASIHHDWTSNR